MYLLRRPLELASVFAVALVICLAGFARGDEATAAAPPIGEWIEKLDSDSYFVREDAARRLAKVGMEAVAPLAEAAQGRGLEMTVRALDILGKLCTSRDAETVAAAESVLESLSQSEDRSVAARAEAALQPRNMARRVAAIERLTELGAKTIMHEGRLVEITLADEWKGRPADLELFHWLVDLQSLVIRDVELNENGMRHLSRMNDLVNIELNGTQLADDELTHVKNLPNLVYLHLINVELTDAAAAHIKQLNSKYTRVALFGTRMTKQAADKLSLARPDLTIDHRDGALLGVAGRAHQVGCIIETVRPGTAAAEAGIQLGDVITHFDDHPVGDFVELTAMIARKKPGDKATLKFRRGAAVLDREVKFGSW